MEDDALDIKNISILEDSDYFVKHSMNSLDLQMRRLKQNQLVSANDCFEFEADINFYIVALRRFRRAMSTCKCVEKINPELSDYLNHFDAETDFTRKMRDILEHINDYVPNSGKKHHKNIDNSELYFRSFDRESFNWAGFEFDKDEVHKAVHDLYEKYRKLVSREYKLYRNSK